jgi:hypothetical protein
MVEVAQLTPFEAGQKQSPATPGPASQGAP